MTNPTNSTHLAANQLHLPTVAIFITAASWAGFAVWLGVNPGALLPAFGIVESTPQMLTEVRALFFDKPPDRSWNLPWHKDTSIAVKDLSIQSSSFSRPTTKAGVPHLIACDEVLRRMLTLRIHLDEVSDENGPLRVIPGSHVSSTSDGIGVDSAATIHAAVDDVLAIDRR